MKINANDIESIEEAGELASSPVKMIRTKGGLWIAVGRPQGKLKEEALAAGSHPAIVKYSLEKKYADFRPSLQKSESLQPDVKVMQHSHFLSEDLRKSGYDIYSMENQAGVEFVVHQHGITRGSVKGEVKNGTLEITSIQSAHLGPMAKAIMSAIAEKALTENYVSINMKGVK